MSDHPFTCSQLQILHEAIVHLNKHEHACKMVPDSARFAKMQRIDEKLKKMLSECKREAEEETKCFTKRKPNITPELEDEDDNWPSTLS